MDSSLLWIAILGTALGTLAMRICFLGPWAREKFPPWLENALRFAPPVIFAALITPLILKLGHEVPTAQLFARITAVVVTLIWAIRLGGQVLPLFAGFASLHLVQRLFS